jgi:hypothetical protein
MGRLAHFFNRRFDDAVANLLLSLEELPTWPTPYRLLAACYAQIGQLGEAREVYKRLQVFAPDVISSTTPYRDPEHRDLYLSGLRLAAGEET